MKVFNEMDISTPKKDQCNLCISHGLGQTTDMEDQKHRDKVEEARIEKHKDNEQSGDENLYFAVDLQAVLLCPRLNVSANYYKTKLKVHNWTFYNLCSTNVKCFVWQGLPMSWSEIPSRVRHVRKTEHPAQPDLSSKRSCVTISLRKLKITYNYHLNIN